MTIPAHAIMVASAEAQCRWVNSRDNPPAPDIYFSLNAPAMRDERARAVVR